MFMFRSNSGQPTIAVAPGRKPRWSLIQGEQSTLVVPLVFFCLIFVGYILLIVSLNNGHLIYTMDDAYIHLALAENIARGHYGINMNELSAPSSSILWPFLLVPFANLPFGDLVPLVINLAASLGTLAMMHRIFGAAFASIVSEKKSEIIASLLILMIFATNMLGLVFMGMEHSLQLFLAVTVVAGLIEERTQRRVTWWLALVLVLGPLVRYECMLLTAPAFVYLLWRREYRAVLLCGIVLGIALLGFTQFMNSLGLGGLPTSVFAKGGFSDGRSGLDAIGFYLMYNLITGRQASLMMVGIVLLLVKRESQFGAFRTWVLSASVLYILFGRFSAHSRYEIFIWATLLLALIVLYGETLWRVVFGGSSGRTALILVTALGAICSPYISFTALTPIASNNIYVQQYQMHRFVDEYYKAPVAINDLGVVSYRSDQYVLDLAGLASTEALAKHDIETSNWIGQLALSYNVKFAMIYDIWFPTVPSDWTLVGKLVLEGNRITPSSSTVSFYALDPETAEQVQPLLRDFQASLPQGAHFELALLPPGQP
jgi:hypothetical protein